MQKIGLLLVLTDFLALPNVERYCDNHVFFDFLLFVFPGDPIEESRHHSPRRDIRGHHHVMAAVSGWNPTTGLEPACEGIPFLSFDVEQRDLGLPGCRSLRR